MVKLETNEFLLNSFSGIDWLASRVTLLDQLQEELEGNEERGVIFTVTQYCPALNKHLLVSAIGNAPPRWASCNTSTVGLLSTAVDDDDNDDETTTTATVSTAASESLAKTSGCCFMCGYVANASLLTCSKCQSVCHESCMPIELLGLDLSKLEFSEWICWKCIGC